MPKNLKHKIKWSTAELQICRAPEDLTISQWMERDIILAGDSAEKGPYRFIRAPYLKPIADICLEPSVEIVVVCKSAQIGGSYLTYGIVFYHSDQKPRPALIVMADEKTAHKVFERRLKTICKASPRLKSKIVKLTKDKLQFIGDVNVDLAWASSVAGLATFEYGLLILDEVDKPGYQAVTTTKEAAPIKLAIERTETYFDRLILLLSTPTIEEGNITKQLETCDIIYDFHVPCGHCGQMQPLRWHKDYALEFQEGQYRAEDGTRHNIGGVVWEGGSKATLGQIDAAGYACGECGAIWSTVEKNNAVEKGKMVARTAIDYPPRKVGYHINRLYSLLGKSGDIPKLVHDWIDCQKDNEELQGFINSTLAEPWKQVITTTTEETILKARCDLAPQLIPPEAVALTCGIDMQLAGFWFVVRAWATDYTSWLIHYGYLPTWKDIENLLFDTIYPLEGSKPVGLRIWRAALDTGGGKGASENTSMTEQAYMWLIQNMAGRGCPVAPTKGSSVPLGSKLKMGQNIDKTPSGKAIPGGIRLIMLDTERLKDMFHYRLDRAVEGLPQGAYLHSQTGIDYAKQILAEEKRLNQKGVEEWIQVRKDNHLLDCETLAHALADPEWPGGGVHLIRPPQQAPANGKSKEKSKNILPKVSQKEWLR